MVSRHLPRLMAACALVSLLASAPAAQAGDKLAERLEAGEIVVTAQKIKGHSVPAFRMMGVVDAPVDSVWQALRRCEDWAGKMPRVERSDVLSRADGKQRCKVRVDLPIPLGHLDSVTEARARRSGDGYQYTWRMVEGDYDQHRGEYKLMPFGPDKGRTLVVYVAHVVPRLSVPSSLLRDGQRRELPDIIKSLRKMTRARK